MQKRPQNLNVFEKSYNLRLKFYLFELEVTRVILIALLSHLMLSRVRLFATPWTVALQAPLSIDFSRQEYCKVKGKVAQSCPILCDPVDYTAQGILQARIPEWVVFPFSRGSSQFRDRAQVSHMAGGFFYHLGHKGNPGILEWVAILFSNVLQ